MQTILKHKIVLIFLVLIVLVAVAYWSFSKGSAPKASTAVTKQAVSATSLPSTQDGPGKEFVTQLLAIQSISFKLDLFRDPVFIGLQDFSRELIEQETGRPNPFAPYGDDSRAGSPSGPSDIFSGNAGTAATSTKVRR